MRYNKKTVKVKIKQSIYRHGQAFRLPEGWGSQTWRQSAHEVGKVASPRYRPPLPPTKYSWYSFLLNAESTPVSQCDRRDYVDEKFRWHHRESNPYDADTYDKHPFPILTCSCFNRNYGFPFTLRKLRFILSVYMHLERRAYVEGDIFHARKWAVQLNWT